MLRLNKGGGKLILPLLAFGGILLWIKNYYYGKKPTRKSQLSSSRQLFKNSVSPIYFTQQEQKEEVEVWEGVHNVKEDYFSQLPDDVLSSILANLNFRDAARTSILSTRWKYLFASLPTLRFHCLDKFGVHHHFDYGCCPYYQRKFLKVVSQVLQLHSGRRVAHIEMDFCFGRGFPSEFDHCMRSISRLGVEILCLSFNCYGTYPIRDSNKFKFYLELLSQASSLKQLVLRNCIVQPSAKVHFNSLLTLSLHGILLASGQLEGILSSCLKLKELFLYYCKLPYKLRLATTVTTIVIWICDGVEEIDFQAANLHMLECLIHFKNVRFFFSYVPMLEYVTVYPGGAVSSIPYIFGDFARDLPIQVKSLTVNTGFVQANNFPVEMKMFRNLRQLSLVVVNRYGIFDIFKLSPLLSACPVLRYLSLVTRTKKGAIRDESRRPPLSPTCHTELKDVRFCGFQGRESEIDFVLYVLRSAIVLEQMFLSPRYRYYAGNFWANNLNVSFNETERNSIQQKLHGQAISGKAVVIIQ